MHFLCFQALSQLANYNPQHMALIAHAFAAFGLPAPSLVSALAARVPACVQQFRGREIAILAMALSKLNCTDSGLLHAITDEVFFRATVGRNYKRRFSFSLLDLQHIAFALVKMGQTDPRIYAVLADCCKEQLRRVCSKASIKGPSTSLMVFAGEGGQDGIRGMPGAQTIACLAHALAKAGVRDRALLGMLERQILLYERQFSSVGLSLVGRAAVSLEMNNRLIWEALQRQGALRAPHMPVDALVSLLSSVSRGPTSPISEAFIRAAIRRMALHITSLPPCLLVAAVVSIQRAGWRDRVFLSRACRLLRGRERELSSRALCGAFAALAKLSVRDAGVYRHLGKEVYARLQELSQEDAASVLYAILLLETQQQPLETHCREKHQQLHRESVQPGQQQAQQKEEQEEDDDLLQQQHEEPQRLRQLVNQEQHQQPQPQPPQVDIHQFDGLLLGLLHVLQRQREHISVGTLYRVQLAALSFRLFRPAFLTTLPYPVTSFLCQASAVSLSKISNVAQSSLLHRSVSRAFSLACVPHQNEVQLGPLCVDLLLGPRVCVEVEGPAHYYRNTIMLTASTRLKLRLLEALGYTVGRISFFEWDQLTTRPRRIVFCAQLARRLLKRVQNSRESLDETEEKIYQDFFDDGVEATDWKGRRRAQNTFIDSNEAHCSSAVQPGASRLQQLRKPVATFKGREEVQ